VARGVPREVIRGRTRERTGAGPLLGGSARRYASSAIPINFRNIEQDVVGEGVTGRLLPAVTRALDILDSSWRLRRVAADGTVTPVLDDVAVSNGTDWNPDGTLM
jgi:hypothetical protein